MSIDQAKAEFARSLAKQLGERIENRGMEFSTVEKLAGLKPKSLGRILRSAKMSVEAFYAIGTATAANLTALVGKAQEDAGARGVTAEVRDSAAPPQRSEEKWDAADLIREKCDEYDARHRRERSQDVREFIAEFRTLGRDLDEEFADGGELTKEGAKERVKALLHKHH